MNSSQAEAQLLISVAFGGICLSAHSWPGTIHPFKIVCQFRSHTSKVHDDFSCLLEGRLLSLLDLFHFAEILQTLVAHF